MSTSQQKTAPRTHLRRQAPETSVHMSILGRDGDDHRVTTKDPTHRVPNGGDGPAPVAGSSTSHAEEALSEESPSHGCTSTSASAPGPVIPRRARGAHRLVKSTGRSSQDVDPQAPPLSYEDKSRWWGKIWGTNPGEHDDQDDETSSQYQPLEAPEAVGIPQRRALVSSGMSNATVTVEDRLKQDCSFFYQGIEETPQSNFRGLQPLASALHHSRLLSTAEGARFRTSYERLNQELTLLDTDDLFLDEPFSSHHNANGTEFTSSVSMSQNTGKLSTLFFEQDGRMLMKLPRDQVRLIMDPDLEPGILSVEQWRKEDRTLFDWVGPSVGDEEEGLMTVLDDPCSSPPTRKTQLLPELRYVMTVPDDLYRRVVAEMSYALMPPWWGCFMCCSESEGRADIKLALVILSVTLFLMFISTMEWPTD